MKKLSILFMSLINLSAFCQDGNTDKIDNETGILPFAIDVPKEELTKFIKGESIDEIDGFVTSAFYVDLDKLGIGDFFGLGIIEMYVEFDGETTSQGENINEDVYSFTLKLKEPVNEEADSEFKNKLIEFFGPAELFVHPFDPSGAVLRYQWWSNITLLTVSFGTNPENGEEMDHYEVKFLQAYGG